VRNKARLVAQGFSQVEGLDFKETFAPVARLKAIRTLLAFAAAKEFKLYQIDVKSAFLYGRQPPDFENPKYPNRVYNLSKALYMAKQASRVWYTRLKTFLLEHGYVLRSVDNTLFSLNHEMTFYLFRFTWMILSLVALIMSLCQGFMK
jgi:hypothetical protein